MAYLGIGRVFPFLLATNDIPTECGVKLPLEGQATTMDTCLEAGNQAQVDTFGDGMRDLVTHSYGCMSRDVIWETAITDIPVLQAFCEQQIDLAQKSRS